MEIEPRIAPPCKWTVDDDGLHNTACGQVFQFIDAGAKENKAKFCIYCGGTLIEITR